MSDLQEDKGYNSDVGIRLKVEASEAELFEQKD